MKPSENTKVTADKLIAQLNGQALSEIALNTNVDFHARKLRGETMLKLLMGGLLLFDNNLSLQTLKTYYHTDFFSMSCNVINGTSISRNALSKRLMSMNPDYFRNIYLSAVDTWGPTLGENSTDLINGLDLEAVDSTMVRDTAHILNQGIMVGRKNRSKDNALHIKYTMGFNGRYATEAIVRTLPKYADEDNALGEAIVDMVKKNPFTSEKSVYIFDRGIKGGDLIASFEDENIRFVGRLNSKRRLELVRASEAAAGQLPEGATLLKDEIVRIYGKDHHNPLPNELRVISVNLGYEIGRRPKIGKKGEQTLTLITDELQLSVAELLEIYRFRWKIEVFFKYLKQYFDLKHMMSASETGLTNMIYITLITALLVKVYCLLNSMHVKGSLKLIWIEIEDSIFKYLKANRCALIPDSSPALKKSTDCTLSNIS